MNKITNTVKQQSNYPNDKLAKKIDIRSNWP